MNMTHHHMVADDTGTFSTDTSGLEECLRPSLVTLDDGDVFDLRISPVANKVGEQSVRMLAYNRSIPGPTLRVQQGSEITIQVRNDADIEATVHWHGLRLDNKYDGVPYETQAPIAIGGEFTYQLRFPDPGLYWYHPHVREDYGLEMGLYGNVVVVPADESYWAPVDREVIVTLDDVLIEDGKVAPFRRGGLSHVAMGRFGNVMLTGGEASLDLEALACEVVRFYFTNTANTRLFNVAIPGARMKLVGGDSGRYEHETLVEEVLLAPSERAIVDVLFDTPGSVPLEHRTPDHTYVLGTIVVSDEQVNEPLTEQFDVLRTSEELVAQRAKIDSERDRAPDKTLAFESSMPLLYGDAEQTAAAWVCPMHPDVVDTHSSTCPKCGMKLVATTQEASMPESHSNTWVCPMHPEVVDTQSSTCPKCGMKLVATTQEAAAQMSHSGHHDVTGHDSSDGLEWEDLMPDINRSSDAHNMHWKLVDRDTGHENWQIDWSFKVGDQVKIKLVNDMEQDHPMHHPFHIHGAGRFLVLSHDGVPDSNLVWKDTVLVRSGETVDILLDVTNPGLWMAHCHIAEHAQSGMMFSFPVLENA